jgi:hypothetical protein
VTRHAYRPCPFVRRRTVECRVARRGYSRPASSEPIPLAGASCGIKLTFSDSKQILGIEPGPAFDAVAWQQVIEEIEKARLFLVSSGALRLIRALPHGFELMCRMKRCVRYLMSVGTCQVPFSANACATAERALLARKAKAVARRAPLELDSVVSPDTLMRWHRRLVARKWTCTHRRDPGADWAACVISRLALGATSYVRHRTENKSPGAQPR